MASFRKMCEDKSIGNAPANVLMAWCPTMDLLAYVTSENHIALHRLSWVKLGTFSENTTRVTALAWSPDGRMLASGHEDGRIVLYDIELQEPVGSFAAHSARVTALSWAPWKGGDGGSQLTLSEDRASKFMPPVISLLDPSNSSGSRSNLRFADAHKAHEMTVLLSGDANGVLSLRSLGASCIGSIQICIPSEDSSKIFGVEIKHISAAPDLSRLAVGVQSTADDVTDQRSSDSSEVLMAPDAMAHKAGTQYLAIVDSQTVASNAAQLLQISSQAWILESAIASLHAALASMKKGWKDAWDHMCGKLKTFEQGLQALGSCSTPESELLTCIASGCASPALQQFLTSIREQGIRRWEKAMDAGCSNIQQLVCQRMLPVTQALIFRAGELQGLARWEQQYLSVGLGESAVDSLLREAERTLHKLTEIGAVTRSFHRGLTLLCHWLEKLTMRLHNDTGPTSISSDEALAIAKFIRAHLCHNRVGALLEGSESCAPFPALEDENPNAELMAALKLSIPSIARVSLSTQLSRLKDAADFAFGETKHCISSKLPIDASVRLANSAEASPEPAEASSRIVIAGCACKDEINGGPLFMVGLRQDVDAQQPRHLLRLLRLSASAGKGHAGNHLQQQVPSSQRASYRIEQASVALTASGQGLELCMDDGDQDMVDWQFYDDERVCLLTKGAAAPSDAHLARIECGKLRWRPLAAVSRSRCLDAASPAVLAAASAADVAMDFSGDVEWRQLPNSMPVCLAVNGRRGLASVMIKEPWRMALLDMEDQDEDADQDESMDQS